MKSILIACAVLSVALFTNGLPTEDDEDLAYFDLIDDEQLADQLINDEQITCVLNGILRVVDNNKDLQWWYDDIEKTVLKMIDPGTRCATMSGIRQDLCLVKFGLQVRKEMKRVKNALPKDKRHLFEKAMEDAVFGCFA